MLCLKVANENDIEKEYMFVQDMPVDENGLLNVRRYNRRLVWKLLFVKSKSKITLV